jgi:hypothetical protein
LLFFFTGVCFCLSLSSFLSFLSFLLPYFLISYRLSLVVFPWSESLTLSLSTDAKDVTISDTSRSYQSPLNGTAINIILLFVLQL